MSRCEAAHGRLGVVPRLRDDVGLDGTLGQRNDGSVGSKHFTGDIQQMLMVREEQHLSLVRKLRENLETGRCPLAVEIDKEIVRDKWKRRRVRQEVLNGCDS